MSSSSSSSASVNGGSFSGSGDGSSGSSSSSSQSSSSSGSGSSSSSSSSKSSASSSSSGITVTFDPDPLPIFTNAMNRLRVTVDPPEAAPDIKLRVENPELCRFAGGRTEIRLATVGSVHFVDVYGVHVFASGSKQGTAAITAYINPEVKRTTITVDEIEAFAKKAIEKAANEGFKAAKSELADQLIEGARVSIKNLDEFPLTAEESIRLDTTLSLIDSNKSTIKQQLETTFDSFARALIAGTTNIVDSDLNTRDLSSLGPIRGASSADLTTAQFRILPNISSEAGQVLLNMIRVGGLDFEQNVKDFIKKPSAFMDSIKLADFKFDIINSGLPGSARFVMTGETGLRWDADDRLTTPNATAGIGFQFQPGVHSATDARHSISIQIKFDALLDNSFNSPQLDSAPLLKIQWKIDF